MGLSALNGQRCDYNFIQYRHCDCCGSENEHVVHYFLDCPHYSATRRTLIHDELGTLIKSPGYCVNTENQETKTNLTNVLLHGHPELVV